MEIRGISAVLLQERKVKAEKSKAADLWKNEKRRRESQLMVSVHCARQWEKEEENKARMKQKEDAAISFESIFMSI